MRGTGLLDQNGTLLDAQRTRDIRRQESELRMIRNPQVNRYKEFNINEKLNQQLYSLANRNLIMQPSKFSLTGFDSVSKEGLKEETFTAKNS